MTIKRFEDMKVWQESRELTKSIYSITQNVKFIKDYGLKDQIQRASVSIMSNIAEGYERDNNKEFIKFLGYSKGSAGEVRSLLYVARDLNYIDELEFGRYYNQCISIITQIANFVKYLRKKIT
jgi:four helix bundle protein